MPRVRCRLIALKNIFSRQLPNMPREYISRLVLDRRHRSVAIVKRKRTVVGGITYRPFHAQVRRRLLLWMLYTMRMHMHVQDALKFRMVCEVHWRTAVEAGEGDCHGG